MFRINNKAAGLDTTGIDITCYKCRHKTLVPMGEEYGDCAYIMHVNNNTEFICNICGTVQYIEGSTEYNIFEN